MSRAIETLDATRKRVMTSRPKVGGMLGFRPSHSRFHAYPFGG